MIKTKTSIESLFSLMEHFILEVVLLFRCKAREERLLETDLQEVATILHEQAWFIGESLLLVHSDKGSSGRSAVSYVEMIILDVNVAMHRTHSRSLYRQIRGLLIISKVELVIEEYFNKNCYLKLILIQSVSFKHKVRLLFIEKALLRLRRTLESEQTLVSTLN
jgi:hypothetical protein